MDSVSWLSGGCLSDADANCLRKYARRVYGGSQMTLLGADMSAPGNIVYVRSGAKKAFGGTFGRSWIEDSGSRGFPDDDAKVTFSVEGVGVGTAVCEILVHATLPIGKIPKFMQTYCPPL